jgi:hypothetical protein
VLLGGKVGVFSGSHIAGWGKTHVDITHTDIQKNALYAGLGVPEFWRFNGREWTILSLVDGQYRERGRSPTFPLVGKADLYRFLETALTDEVTAEIEFRQWVRRQS